MNDTHDSIELTIIPPKKSQNPKTRKIANNEYKLTNNKTIIDLNKNI